MIIKLAGIELGFAIKTWQTWFYCAEDGLTVVQFGWLLVEIAR